MNAVAGLDSLIKRSLTGAWDLAYTWVEAEPGRHHLPMPLPVMAAMISLALVKGWLRIASLLGIGWAGLLRPAEFLNAERRHLVLPRDVLFTVPYLLVMIPFPKTRRSAARYQSARVDPSDIVGLADAVFGKMSPSSPLWPASGGTFRTRFATLCADLGLPFDRTTRAEGFEAGEVLDLGSLRTGGATEMWQRTENAPLVQQRGRWMSVRNMNIYLQELSSTTFLSRLAGESRTAVAELYDSSPWMSKHAVMMTRGAP